MARIYYEISIAFAAARWALATAADKIGGRDVGP